MTFVAMLDDVQLEAPRERVRARLVLDAARLGLEPPPVPVRLRFALEGSKTSVYVHLGDGDAHPVEAWLASLGPQDVERPLRGLLRANFKSGSTPWLDALGRPDVRIVEAGPGGALSVVVVGTRASVGQLAEALDATCASLTIVDADAGAAALHVVTAAQYEVLRMAVDLGYYDLPRSVGLQGLAQRLKVSAGAVSHRLRRAEGRVIAGFVEAYERADDGSLADDAR